MRKVTTILCSVAFMISGIMMAITASDPSPGIGYKTMQAATTNQYMYYPKIVQQTDTGTLDLSEDLIRDLAKRKGVLDTVYITKTDTIKEQVTKMKRRKVTAPSPVMEINVVSRRDTIQVPVYYLATQIGMKEEPTGKCISIYEVHKVDEICTDSINSSAESVTEQNTNVGE